MVNHNNDIDSSSFDIGYSTPMYLDVVSDPNLADIRVALLEPIFEPLDPIFQSLSPPPPPPPPTTKTQPPPPSQEDLTPEVQQQQDELPCPPPQQPQQDLPAAAAAAWLPAGWSIKKRTRVNGASAGNKDKYYLSPEGRKFRSRNAVEAYLSGQDTGVCKVCPGFITKRKMDICVDLGPLLKLDSNSRPSSTLGLVEASSHQDSHLDRRSILFLGFNKVSTNQNIILTGVASSDSLKARSQTVQATINAEVFNRDKAIGAVEERTGTRHGLHQNSRSKSKVSSSHGMRTRNSIKSGSVEEEVVKTVEMGIALGFDFSKMEDVVLEEITRREKEDIARFEAISV
ncbi:hypothetical protein LWI28_002596 [Acer negundo]|uniref:MBD domain-containing protein n=1 Tax=Acer negundo TaxID=4023 RepID=A0AAD5P0W5_ACENE|nr:hypothetical protein LWI28_002596 [Acer negundo]